MNKDGLNITQVKGDNEGFPDKALLFKKIDKALLESEQGLGQDFEEFKKEWLKEDY